MRAYRIACVAILAAAPAFADEPPKEQPLSATLQCDRAAEPGRIRCTVEARTASGRTLQWADVVLVELPDFTQALKGRLAPADSIARDPTSERWAFGLVAKKPGQGEAKVRVRAVVCSSTSGASPPTPPRPPSAARSRAAFGDGGRCAPIEVEAKAVVKVG